MSWIKRRKKWLFLLIIVIAGGYFGYKYYFKVEEINADTVIAKRGMIVREVGVTGKVKPLEEVNLAFEKSGRVESVSAAVGDRVSAGQILARLDASELETQLEKAEADLATQEAELIKTELTLENYYADAFDVLNDAYTKANDAVRKQTDELFSDDERSPQLTFTTSDFQIEIDLEFQRKESNNALNDWKKELDNLNLDSSSEEFGAALVNARSRLILIRNFLDRLTDAVINAIALSQTTINTYKSNINTARGNVNTALTNVNGQEQDINLQKATVNSKKAGINSYRASIANIESQIAKTVLRSPIAGIVTKQDARVGEIVSAAANIISIVSESRFEIEANIPEVDIADVKIGSTAEVTLDAYGSGSVFGAKVISIDPAEIVIEGVSTYKVKLVFTSDAGGKIIRSGMTANIDILSDKRENVIVIPQRAVISKNGVMIVRILNDDGTITEAEVQTGLRGSDGNIEIVGGVGEGERVITFLREK